MKLFSKVGIACGLSVFCLMGPQALSALEIEEITVTAQKREQSITDVGIAINVISGEALDELGVSNTIDIAALIPGFTFADSGNGAPIYNLRGVGFDDQSYNASATVGVYIDEAGLPFPIMSLGTLLDIERVEVLKGPQGTLYGRNTTAGAVNYITAKPTDEFEAGLSATYGRYDTVVTDGYVSGPLTDRLRARLAAKTTQSGEGWQENNFNDDKLGKRDASSARLTLEADITDNFDSLVQLSWWEEKSDTRAPQLIRGEHNGAFNAPIISLLAPLQATAALNNDEPEIAGWTKGQDFDFDLEYYSATVRFNFHINDRLKFTSLTNYAKMDDNGSTHNQDGIAGLPFAEVPEQYLTTFDLLGLNGGVPIPIIDPAKNPYVSNINFTNIGSLKTVSQELRLSYEGDSMTLLGGLYYARDEARSADTGTTYLVSSGALGTLFGPPLNFGALENTIAQKTDVYGVFAHTEWALRENLNLTVALRYGKDKIDFDACGRDASSGSVLNLLVALGRTWLAGVQPGECLTTLVTTDTAGNATLRAGEFQGSLNEDSVSWRFGLDWSVNENTLLFATYSRGFKSGSFPNLSASFDSQYAPVTQEQLDSFELGIKTALADGLAQVNASVFYYDYKNKQLFGSVVDEQFGTLDKLFNIPEADVLGFEADIQWEPLDGLYLQFGASYIETEVSEFTNVNKLGVDINFDGSSFTYAPEIQLNAIANYTWSISTALDMYVGLDASYSDDSTADFEPSQGSIDPAFVLDDYTLLNARIGVTSNDRRWRAYLWSRNLTDEHYTNNVLNRADALLTYTGMPRTYGITIEYNH